MGTLFFAVLAESRELPALLELLAIALIAASLAWVYEQLLTNPDHCQPLEPVDDDHLYTVTEAAEEIGISDDCHTSQVGE